MAAAEIAAPGMNMHHLMTHPAFVCQNGASLLIEISIMMYWLLELDFIAGYFMLTQSNTLYMALIVWSGTSNGW